MRTFVGSLIKYILRFCFFILIGTFLFGLAKFKFNFLSYARFLNSMDIQQIFSSSGFVSLPSSNNGDQNAILSGYTGNNFPLDEDIINMDFSAKDSGSSQTGSYGFLNPSLSGNESLSSGNVFPDTDSSSPISGDTRKELLNLIKSREN